MKKLLKIVLALSAVSIALSGCSKKLSSDAKKIGVLQLVQHPALDANYQGFVDGLKEAGYIDGENISITYQNAQGEVSNCNQVAETFVNDNVDLIFAIATPAAQSVANKTDTIPILVSSVTDPQDAGLVVSNDKPDTNVSGTSDLTPIAEQINLLNKLFPEAKTVGLMYCSSETNSVFQINLAKEACDKLGLKYIEGSVSNSNEIKQVTQSLIGKVDALYIPTDNMLAAGMPTVAMVANEAKLPLIVGEEGMVDNGGLVTIGINYYELGKQTAAMAVEILKNGKSPKDMPIQYQKNFTLKSNPETANILGVTIPESL